jgi:hypothetical protein
MPEKMPFTAKRAQIRVDALESDQSQMLSRASLATLPHNCGRKFARSTSCVVCATFAALGSLDQPVRTMRLTCSSCGKAYNLPDDKVAEPSNAKLRCNACGAMTDIKRQGKIVIVPPREVQARVAFAVAGSAPIAAAVNSRLQAALLTGFVLGFILSHWTQ